MRYGKQKTTTMFKHVNKVALLIFAALLVVSVAALVCACNSSEVEHDHNYLSQVTKEPTCIDKGVITYTCECGETYTDTIPANGHSLSYKFNSDGHWQQCDNCDYVTTVVRHNFQLSATIASTCAQKGSETYLCICGEQSIRELDLAPHSLMYESNQTKHWQQCSNCDYVTDEVAHDFKLSTTVPSTCIQKGSETSLCVCGKESIRELELAEHNLVFYPSKKPTNGNVGNIDFWQCQVCNKYFLSPQGDELTEDEVFITEPQPHIVESLAELFDIANNQYLGQVSSDYYQITLLVDVVNVQYHQLAFFDEVTAEMFIIDISPLYDITTIFEGNEITIKGRISGVGDITLVDVVILSVDDGKPERVSLYIETIGDADYWLYVANSTTEFVANRFYFNSLTVGDTLTVMCSVDAAALLRVLINGKTYTAQDGVIELEITTEDIYIQLIFASYDSEIAKLIDILRKIWYILYMKCDLHLHSNCSDGIFSPQDLVDMAKERGLDCISITDHDTFAATVAAKQRAEAVGLKYVVGAELSSVSDLEAHILAYNVDTSSNECQDALAKIADLRCQRNVAMVNKLSEHGIVIDLDELRKHGSVGRAVIAREMVRLGYCKDVPEAFDRYIGAGKCCFVQTRRLTHAEAIQFTLRFGGIPVLAHPKQLRLGKDEFEAFLKQLVSYGLGGIEAHYFTHNMSERNYYCRLAKKYKLVCTGGSDFHDYTHGVELGTKSFSPNGYTRTILGI